MEGNNISHPLHTHNNQYPTSKEFKLSLNRSHPIGKGKGLNVHSTSIATKIKDQDSIFHPLNGSLPMIKETRLNVHFIPIVTMIHDQGHGINMFS